LSDKEEQESIYNEKFVGDNFFWRRQMSYI